MVVLGPERTFKLRNPLVQSSSSGHQQQSGGLLQAVEDGMASLRGAASSPFNTAKIRSVRCITQLKFLLYYCVL